MTCATRRDLLAHLPQDGAIPVVRRMSLMEDDKERYDVPVGFEPRTPVTVTSSFEEKWLHGVSTPTLGAHAALPMVDGGGNKQEGTAGKGKENADAQWRVDHSNVAAATPKVAVMNRRGVGPGIT
jgi:hypothetical protein